MNNKILISFLSAVVIGLIIIPDSITGTHGSFPFMVGATVVCGITVYSILCFFDSLLSVQREYKDLINNNSERHISELVALKLSLGKYQKENSELLSRVSSQQLSSIEQFSKHLINTLTEIETQLILKIDNLTVRTNEVKNEISSTIVLTSEKMNSQIIKQNEVESNLLKDLLDKHDKVSDDFQKAFSIAVVKLNELLIDKSELIESKLNRFYEIQTSTNNSINSLKELIDDRFDNLIGMNSQYEKSLNTINNSIEQFFKDNETLQKDIQETVGEIKILQENMQKFKEEQDKVIEEILQSAILEMKDISTSTVSILDKNNNDLRTEIHSLIQQIKIDSDLCVSSISETMKEHRLVTEEVFQSALNEVKRISRDANTRMEGSSKELNDTLKEMFEDQNDEIADVTKELENIGNKIEDNITIINLTISEMYSEMERISSTIPQIKELSKSEEQLMKDLERICTSKR